MARPETSSSASRAWLRAGIILLAALDGVVGLWQYFRPRSFFDDFPTVDLQPPYNEHLVADIGGLNLALVAIVVFAAVTLDHRVVMSALTAFAVYAGLHFAYHVLHFEGFSAGEVAAVGTGLGVEVVLTILLLGYAPYVHRRDLTQSR